MLLLVQSHSYVRSILGGVKKTGGPCAIVSIEHSNFLFFFYSHAVYITRHVYNIN